jgi:hypothetical protein
MKTEEQLQDYTHTFTGNMKMQNTDKYGVCHTVVEKKKFYKCTRRTMEHYSIWKMSLSHNDNLVRKTIGTQED